jgi:hypothetical protein
VPATDNVTALCEFEAALFEQRSTRIEAQLGQIAFCVSNPVRV